MSEANFEPPEVLVIEDSKPVRKLICHALWDEGYATAEAATRVDAFELLRESCFDLVLLDLTLGDGNGMDVLEVIRRQDDEIPVMIVSSTASIHVKVSAFDSGCDDYVTKPFDPAELLGRVRRLLRRSTPRRTAGPDPRQPIEQEIHAGPFRLDLRSGKVRKNGIPLSMRKKVFDLFVFFVRNADQILSKELLHERIWNGSTEANANSIYVHIHELRSIIEDDPSRPVCLQTVRGLGFVFRSACN